MTWDERVNEAMGFYAGNYLGLDVPLPTMGPAELDTMEELIQEVAKALVMTQCQKARLPLMEIDERLRRVHAALLDAIIIALGGMGESLVINQNRLKEAGY